MDNQSKRTMDWIKDIVLRNENKLYRTAIAITGNKSDAEDIVQDAFVKLLDKKPDFESQDHETAWLMRVTINLCKNHLKSYWRKKTVPILESYPAKSEEDKQIIEIISSLPVKYRTVIHLYYYEGYSTKEIAEITNQKESTVREQMTRARRKLKDFIKENDNEGIYRIHG